MHKAIKKIYHWTIPYEGNSYKPHVTRHRTLAFYSGAMIAIKLFVLALLFFSYPSPAEFYTITVNHIVELTNQAREDAGFSTLKHSAVLDAAAAKKAADMFRNNYFAHTSPQGIKPWHWFNEVEYNYTFAGENLAMNFVDAEGAVQAWLDSPSHRDNLLSKNYEDIGVAVAVGQIDGAETTLVVQLFGKTYLQVQGESFAPTSAPIEAEQVAGPINIVEEAAQKEIKLEEKPQQGFVAKVIYYSERFFIVLLGFIILNLILTIIIRVEIQHKPIIAHSLFVIFLALAMIFMKFHFIEQVGRAVNII